MFDQIILYQSVAASPKPPVSSNTGWMSIISIPVQKIAVSVTAIVAFSSFVPQPVVVRAVPRQEFFVPTKPLLVEHKFSSFEPASIPVAPRGWFQVDPVSKRVQFTLAENEFVYSPPLVSLVPYTAPFPELFVRPLAAAQQRFENFVPLFTPIALTPAAFEFSESPQQSIPRFGVSLQRFTDFAQQVVIVSVSTQGWQQDLSISVVKSYSRLGFQEFIGTVVVPVPEGWSGQDPLVLTKVLLKPDVWSLPSVPVTAVWGWVSEAPVITAKAKFEPDNYWNQAEVELQPPFSAFAFDQLPVISRSIPVQQVFAASLPGYLLLPRWGWSSASPELCITHSRIEAWGKSPTVPVAFVWGWGGSVPERLDPIVRQQPSGISVVPSLASPFVAYRNAPWPELFVKPLDVSQQRFEDLGPAGRIISITPQGWAQELSVSLVKPFAVYEQQWTGQNPNHSIVVKYFVDPRFITDPSARRLVSPPVERSLDSRAPPRRLISTPYPRHLISTPQPRRQFTIPRVTGVKLPQGPDFSTLDTTEAVNDTFDFGPWLPSGVTLTGTPTVTCSVYSGSDSAAPSRLVGTPVFVASPSSGATQAAVLQQIGNNPVAGVTYRLDCSVTTSDGQVLNLWAHQLCQAPN
jgi:hypothetical protein